MAISSGINNKNIQYLVCSPFISRTVAICHGIDHASFLQYSIGVSSHTFSTIDLRFSNEVGFCSATFIFMLTHKFLIGLRSGDDPGHGPITSPHYLPAIFFTDLAVWQGAPS